MSASDVIDASTLDRKLIFGYQGWFGCPSDGSPVADWQHWFRRGSEGTGANLRVDMWPDVSELEADEQCATELEFPGGRPAPLYSAYHPRTVDRHFRWMREYGLPGVLLQRFTVELRRPAYRAFRDAVTSNVRAAAERHGRVFAVMYDISGHPAGPLVADIERDWLHLVDELRVTDSSSYLHHAGRPVVAIWGFGFANREPTPAQAAELIAFFHDHPDPRCRATIVGGVPARWRTLREDSQPDPRWADVYRSFDIISPWTIGRFRTLTGVDEFYAQEVRPDLDVTRAAGIGYLPVLFPGFSWRNLHDGPLNQIPRLGGEFYWRQVARALDAGATMLYGAMFDEVDEGTAMFKLAASPREAPDGVPTVTLDADGVPLPSDWYLRLAQEAQRRLRRPNRKP